MGIEEHTSWSEEKQSAFLYRTLAEHESGTSRENLFRELALAAESQADLWLEKIRERGGAPPAAYQPSLRARIVGRMLTKMGPRPLRVVLAAMKIRGMSLYADPVAEHHAIPGERGEHRHRAIGRGGNLRAAVFGVNDGLVSNAALILGVAGAEAESQIILLAGTAGLLAGAFSMAAGEYISVRSQSELYEYQIALEKEELETYPEEEAEELALIYQARGLERDEAVRLSNSLIADPERALETLTREELGLNPSELGSAWGAAMSSFAAFGAGALLPLLPFLFGSGNHLIFFSIAIAAGALFSVGAILSLFTGRSALWSGFRMLLIGTGAGAITYGLGRLLGVSLS